MHDEKARCDITPFGCGPMNMTVCIVEERKGGGIICRGGPSHELPPATVQLPRLTPNTYKKLCTYIHVCVCSSSSSRDLVVVTCWLYVLFLHLASSIFYTHTYIYMYIWWLLWFFFFFYSIYYMVFKNGSWIIDRSGVWLWKIISCPPSETKPKDGAPGYKRLMSTSFTGSDSSWMIQRHSSVF